MCEAQAMKSSVCSHGSSVLDNGAEEIPPAVHQSGKQRKARARKSPMQAQLPSFLTHMSEQLREEDQNACQQVREHMPHMQAPLAILELGL